MCDQFRKTHEITKLNFEQRYQEIETSLRNAQFVCFDTEFTGAPRKNSTWKLDGTNNFETPERVYANLKQDASSLIIIQLGITAFYFDSKANKYEATSYAFYVFPRSLPSLQKTFGIHGSVMELLSSLNFDFNKVVYDGISCLNLLEEKNFREELFTNSILGQTKRPMSMEDERIIQEKCAIISKWECTAKVGDSMELGDLDYSKKLVVYLLIKKIHAKFPVLWTFPIDNDLDPSTPRVLVEKVSDLKRGELQSLAIKYETYENELLKHFVGVSRIFKLLVKMKKPIIGSGALFDLMLMYHQFHEPLPDKYGEFKASVSALFPHVYDSKHVTYAVRELCRRRGLPLDEADGLAVLDEYFHAGCGSRLPSAQPAIRLADAAPAAPPTIRQDAGWDSYYTGCCFLRMAHFLAKENKYGCNAEVQPQMTLPALFAAGIREYRNCLHIAPATVDYLRLDGPDPVAEKPRSLLVTSTSPLPAGREPLYRDLAEVARGSVQIKMLKRGRACVTVNSRRSAAEIARRCHVGHDYSLRDYTNAGAVKRTVITGGAIAFASLLLWKIYRLLN